ncbi:MAG: flavin monoamine oxidase family protein [Granulosicoccus sp.]
MKTDVIIIGAGLSGLRIAQQLQTANVSVKIVDARERLGGRIHSKHIAHSVSDSALDMGPSWFWPWQKRMMALMQELELAGDIYEQYSDGLSVAEYRNGQLLKQAGIASMAGSLRLRGGLKTLVDALSRKLSNEEIRLNTQVTALAKSDKGVDVSYRYGGDLNTLFASHVVLAAPPRVINQSIQFSPDWDTHHQDLINHTPTWMAGQAKFSASYEKPFWREQGLSGDAVSEIGPLGEIHDASAATGAPYALFGFVGVPAAARVGHAEDIKAAAIEQLTRLFGHEAANPTATVYKDWAEDNLTATESDRAGPRAHAHQTVNTDPHWNQSLYWAGSETACTSSGDNGYLEGALDAAERVVKQITSTLAV